MKLETSVLPQSISEIILWIQGHLQGQNVNFKENNMF